MFSHPQGLDPNPKALIPLFRDLGLKTGIFALRLEFRPRDWDLGLETGIWASGLGFEGGYKGGGGKEGEGNNSPVW